VRKLDRFYQELQQKLRRLICADRLWQMPRPEARDQRKVRSLMGDSKFTVVGMSKREEIFSNVLAEEKDCHTKKVGCDKEPVIAGR